MQTIIVLFYHQTLKKHWGFDDPAGKEWSEFQRVRDEIKLAIEKFKLR